MSRTRACVGRESRGEGRSTHGIQRSLKLGPCDSLTPYPDSRKTLRQFSLMLRAALEEVSGDLDSSGLAVGKGGWLLVTSFPHSRHRRRKIQVHKFPGRTLSCPGWAELF